MLRQQYDQKFICHQCGETVFVFGQTRALPPSVCAICRALAGWKSGLEDRQNWPEALRFHAELHALVSPGSFNENGPTSIHCIYLDARGRSQQEP
jgi:hypothetical protein